MVLPSQMLSGRYASSNFKALIVHVEYLCNTGIMFPPAEMQPPQGQMVMTTWKSKDCYKQIMCRSDTDHERLPETSRQLEHNYTNWIWPKQEANASFLTTCLARRKSSFFQFSLQGETDILRQRSHLKIIFFCLPFS